MCHTLPGTGEVMVDEADRVFAITELGGLVEEAVIYQNPHRHKQLQT